MAQCGQRPLTLCLRGPLYLAIECRAVRGSTPQVVDPLDHIRNEDGDVVDRLNRRVDFAEPTDCDLGA